jgi:hypothetical protein
MGMVVSQKNLVISQHNSAKIDQTLGLIQDLHTQMQAISISFSKERDIRQTADALMQRAEEKLNEPTIAKGLATEISKFPSDPGKKIMVAISAELTCRRGSTRGCGYIQFIPSQHSRELTRHPLC